MLSKEQNDLITLTGPRTPAGAVMRHHWQPVALTEELETDRPVKAVRILGEELVLFRDDQSRYGLLERRCPHRGADLCYGRREDGGLRCAFHGWLFDVDGQCLEQPAEPLDSTYYQRIQHTAYPCVQRNGIVFAWLGSRAPTELPALDCFVAPDEYTFAFKGRIDCNWLQALEVGIDPAHASFLHRFIEDDDPSEAYGKQFRDRAAELEVPLTAILRNHPRPEILVEPTDYGSRIIALRTLDDQRVHVRVTNQVFPNAITIPMSNEMNITQWHVPIDDVSCYWYAIFTSFGATVDKQLMREQRLELYELPDYVARRNSDNHYGFDAEEQRTRTYTGMGEDINVHDQWAVESMGPIQDRTREHLARSDAAIRAYRRQLSEAINAFQNEQPPVAPDPALLRGPVAIDAISPDADWRACWQERDRERRRQCAWPAELDQVAP